MCAIFGILGSFDSSKALQAFNALNHRGPDESYIYETEKLFMAYHRLAVVDKRSKPETFKAGVRIVFNGEIYNYKKLKEELSTYDFKSQGDSEVLLAAYLTWGESFIDKVEGMFALAIFDETQDKLLLFRDKLGKKPLYYYYNRDCFVFASELKAITKIFPEIERSQTSMVSFLSFQTTLAPQTFYQDVVSLQACEKMIFSSNKLTKSFYDDILPSKITVYKENEALKNLETALQKSIKTRMSKEVDTAYLLSGGVDSSLIAAMAQQYSDTPLETFTLGYEGESKYDESLYAKEVADFIGAKNERIVYGFEDFKRDITDILSLTDQPLNDPALLPLSHLVKNIKTQTQAKIIISGEGSDELFLGYRPYKELFDIEQLAGLRKKSWLKSYFLKHPSEHREWEWYRRILNDELLFRSSAESFSIQQRNSYLKRSVFDDSGLEQIKKYHEHYLSYGLDDPLLWYRYIDLKVHQSDYFLMKLDRVSMHHGLEARTPFLDDKLVKESLSMNSALFLKNDINKYLLKKVALNYLPEGIVHRKKRGFSYPFIEWLEKMGGFKQMKQLNDKHQIFDVKALNYLLQTASKGAFKQHVFGMFLLLQFLESQ